jgi:wyosine [tRNA(Phe)-imidazoG37] synthetase (radical SAM superfamily)
MPLRARRVSFVPAREIVEELREALKDRTAAKPDWVTFVGSGEPTLHRDLGWMIRQVKEITSIPVAVITNGSLLGDAALRNELLLADAVLPTLDAGEEALYRTINRPHPWFSFQRHLDGLIAFRQEYPGRLWLEVMLVKNLNDSEEALNAIHQAVQQIQPDQVHLSLPLRGPAEPWVLPAGSDGLERAARILGQSARVLSPIPEGVLLRTEEGMEEAVLRIVRRHPMEQGELLRAIENAMENIAPGQALELLETLARSGRAQAVTRFGRRFWTAGGARFVPLAAASGAPHPQGRA